MSLDSKVGMDEGWRYTLVENDTDTKLSVEYGDVKYALRSKRSALIVRWNTFVGPSFIKIITGAVQLDPMFSNCDLRQNVQITIFRDVANTYSCRMTPRTALNNLKLNFQGSFKSICHISIWERVKFHVRRMENLQRKVRIWHNQCAYLFKKFQEGVERVELADLAFQTVVDLDLEACYKDVNYVIVQHPFALITAQLRVPLEEFIVSTLIRSMYEGEALLRSCGELSYNKAAFALSSLPPSVPTFSKFALATRELNWIVDFLCCDPEEKSRFDSWEWCEERCRLVSSNGTNRLDAMEDDSLEADVRRQKADRDALQASLHLKLSRSHGSSSFKFLNPITSCVLRGNTINQGLEAIWRKRLQPSSCAPGSYSPLDAFVIENPDSRFVELSVVSSRNGASKSVQKCKWLGETVALSRMSNVSKISAKAETGFLARVQHPNVVEWMGYAFKEDIRDPNCYRDCYLVTEHMESDLHDLITERLTDCDGTISTNRRPFRFLVAVDIALQVVEAMIHVHKCRILHRDLKPKNILVSRKYSQPASSRVPIYYTIKLIDFGSSKIGEECSHFHTRKQGTTMYMAPEVWESEDSYSWSADVYSFGLTCYEIFHGRLPWKSDMTFTFANFQKVMRGKIRFPFVYPEELKELIEKCWAQNPSDRPSFEVIRKALWRLKFHPFRNVTSNSAWVLRLGGNWIDPASFSLLKMSEAFKRARLHH